MSINKYWSMVWQMIDEADVVLEVIDARFPSICRSNQLEQGVVDREHCNLLIAMNKADLVPREHVNRWSQWFEDTYQYRAIGVSATERLGTSILRSEILRQSRKKTAVTAVVGLPNTGKSSLINALSGRRATRVAPIAGHTKGYQKVNVSKSIQMFDTPGILPIKLPLKHRYLLGVIPITKIKDPIKAAFSIYEQYQDIQMGQLAQHFGLSDTPNFLEELAIKLNRVRKGGIPDEEAAALYLLREAQAGHIPVLEDCDHPLRFDN